MTDPSTSNSPDVDSEVDSFVSRYRLRGPLEALPGEVTTPVFRAIERGTGDPYFLYRGDERLSNAPQPTGSLVDPESLLGRARAVADLDHDAFAPLHDYGTLESGKAYLCWVSEPGETLRARVERSPLDLLEAVYIVGRIAEALEILHRSGWEHGALRPASVFQTSLGGIRLPAAGLEPADLFRRQNDELEERTSPVGWAAAAYLAPEQLPTLTGDPPKDDPPPPPDHRVDIWALGILLYELASGRLPFQGRSFEAMARAIRGTLPEPFSPIPGQAPPELDRILGGCLAQDPSARYSSAETLLVDLQALARVLEPEMRPKPAVGGVSRGPRSTAPPPEADTSLRGLLDQVAERRRRVAQEPGPTWWQVLLPPAFLVALVAAVVWLLLRTS